MDFEIGQIYYSGYPTAKVHNFGLNSKKQLRLQIVKDLLWGDWTTVIDYDFLNDPERQQAELGERALTTAERDFVKSQTEEMVGVDVRGQKGYMHPEDLGDEQLMEVVFVDVGQGDGTFLVTPDNRIYIIDSGKGDNMRRYADWRFKGFEGDEILLDGLIITHPDNDHYRGFYKFIENDKEFQKTISARQVWINGLMEQFSVDAASDKQSNSESVRLGRRSARGGDGQHFLIDLMDTDEKISSFLADQDRWIKRSTNRPKEFPGLMHEFQNATVQREGQEERRFHSIDMLSTAHGSIVQGQAYVPGYSPDDATELDIEVLAPVVETLATGGQSTTHALRTFSEKPLKATRSMDLSHTKNGHSIVLRLAYKDVRLLLGGDLNSAAETFLLSHYTEEELYDPVQFNHDAIVSKAQEFFGADVAKCCHHGSADFTDIFLQGVNAVATVVSSGDEESHAHPRSDTLGAIGNFGRGDRSLIFSTELARSAPEFIAKEDSPWAQALDAAQKLRTETDPEKIAQLESVIEEREKITRKRVVTVYGSINLRTDGHKLVMAYMLEKPSDGRRWDVYTMESLHGSQLFYVNVKEAEKREKIRREQANADQ